MCSPLSGQPHLKTLSCWASGIGDGIRATDLLSLRGHPSLFGFGGRQVLYHMDSHQHGSCEADQCPANYAARTAVYFRADDGRIPGVQRWKSCGLGKEGRLIILF